MTDTLMAALEVAPGPSLPKAPTGITGLDDITSGGLPRGRTTLVAGGAGSGKSMFAVEFLVRGARDFDEPGVLITFEETADKVTANVTSLGFDLDALVRQGKLVVQGFAIDPTEIVETGAFDLDGLLIFLAAAVERVNARRVVLDTIEVLLGMFADDGSIRGEIARLFRWLEAHGITAIVTGERGERQITRHGIEEYVSDCVILLDHRVEQDVSTRRLRIVKYRGSAHGTDEYPFLITGGGFVVQPLSAAGLAYSASTERMSTGVAQLDHMLGGGVYRGSTVLMSGSAGTGKTSLVAKLTDAACARGEQVLYVLYEESPDQLIRNMRSIGIDLQRWADAGRLHFYAARPSAYGLENHLAGLTRLLDEGKPDVVVLDALTSFAAVASAHEVGALITRMVAAVKSRGVTAVLTSLTQPESELSATGVSSLVDTWLLLRNVESNGERNRLLSVNKSRGTKHSNQVREFLLTDDGPTLIDAYLGPEGMFVGSARIQRQTEDRQEQQRRSSEVDSRQRDLDRRASEVQVQIAALEETLAETDAEMKRLAADADRRSSDESAGRGVMRRHRWVDAIPPDGGQR